MKSNENYENDEKRLRMMKNNENDGELMQNWWRTDEDLMKYWWRTDEELRRTGEELVKNWWRTDAECDIRENFDTNECPNIFVSTKLHEWISEYIHTNFFDTNECLNKYSYWKLHEYSNIFEYSSRFYTLTHSWTNVQIYLYKQIWHERMSEYIGRRKIDTNEYPNIFVQTNLMRTNFQIYICDQYIRIFKYICHTLTDIIITATYPIKSWTLDCVTGGGGLES